MLQISLTLTLTSSELALNLALTRASPVRYIGDGEADAPGMHGDVLAEQAAARVLLDAEQAEEGEESGAPVAGVGELAQVEARTDGVQVLESEAATGSGDVVVAVPVEDAGSDALEGAASRQVGVAQAHGVVGDGGHEAGEAGDAVVLDVQMQTPQRWTSVRGAEGSMRMEAQMERNVRCRDSYARWVLRRRA